MYLFCALTVACKWVLGMELKSSGWPAFKKHYIYLKTETAGPYSLILIDAIELILYYSLHSRPDLFQNLSSFRSENTG